MQYWNNLVQQLQIVLFPLFMSVNLPAEAILKNG